MNIIKKKDTKKKETCLFLVVSFKPLQVPIMYDTNCIPLSVTSSVWISVFTRFNLKPSSWRLVRRRQCWICNINLINKHWIWLQKALNSARSRLSTFVCFSLSFWNWQICSTVLTIKILRTTTLAPGCGAHIWTLLLRIIFQSPHHQSTLVSFNRIYHLQWPMSTTQTVCASKRLSISS